MTEDAPPCAFGCGRDGTVELSLGPASFTRVCYPCHRGMAAAGADAYFEGHPIRFESNQEFLDRYAYQFTKEAADAMHKKEKEKDADA